MIRERLSHHAKQAARTVVFAVGRYVPFVRTLARHSLAARNGRRYRRLVATQPLDPKTIVFQCYSGRGYSCSPRAIYRAMLGDPAYRDNELVWGFKGDIARALAERHVGAAANLDDVVAPQATGPDLERDFGAEALEELSRATIVVYGSEAYNAALARAGAIVTNSILSAHVTPREGQVYLQTWHGTPLKRLGCDLESNVKNATFLADEIHERYTFEGRRFTHLVSPSPFASEKLSTAFDLPRLGMTGKVIETGYPRNDFLATATSEQVAAIRRRLGLPEGKRVVLYAPTFRDDQHRAGLGYTYEAGVDFDYLREQLGEDHILLFRPHYLVANSFDFDRYRGFIHDVSSVSDINDLYVLADVLVTDYSSVFFDFANLRRPMVFYMYDLERYAEELRGFYLQLSELPGPIVRTDAELVAEIRAAEKPSAERDEVLLQFRERFAGLDDGHAAERVIARAIAPVQREPDAPPAGE